MAARAREARDPCRASTTGDALRDPAPAHRERVTRGTFGARTHGPGDAFRASSGSRRFVHTRYTRLPMDDARRRILARRARFVAAAVAGLSVGACGKRATPAAPEDAAPSASTPASVDTAPPAIDAGDLAPPMVCLIAPVGSPRDGAPAPSVKVSAKITVDGSVSNADSLVQAHLVPKARACYRHVLAVADPTSQGRVTIAIVIGAGGAVERASASSSAGVARPLVDCCVGAARGLQFDPNAAGATITVDATFAIEK